MNVSSEVVSVYAREVLESLDSASATVNRLLSDLDRPDSDVVFYVAFRAIGSTGSESLTAGFETEAEAVAACRWYRDNGYAPRVMYSRESF